MVILDVSVVNVALPSMKAELGFDQADLPWVVNAYTLTFAGFLLLGGRMADLFGRKRMFVLALAFFAVASLIGGLAANPAQLIAARAGQGLGGALLAPTTLSILTTTFAEGPARTRAVAIWSALGVAGGLAGSVLGGLLTEFLSWRWTLLINVPIAAVVIAFALLRLARDTGRPNGQRLDLPGAVLATAGLAGLAYAITRTEDTGWSDPGTLTILTGALVTLAAFVFVQGRVAKAPLIPLRLFTLRSLSVGNVTMLLTAVALMPMWYFLTLYMQDVLRYDPMQTGLGFLPHTLVTMLVGTQLTPRLLRRMDARPLIIAGALLGGAGFLWQSAITPDSGYLEGILGPAVVISAGSGLLITPITTTVTSGVGASDAGAASGLMNTARQVGATLGLAVLVTVAAGHSTDAAALAAGYERAFVVMAGALVAVGAVAFALPRTRRDDVVGAPAD